MHCHAVHGVSTGADAPIQVDPNAPRVSKKKAATSSSGGGGLNPYAIVLLLIAIAAGVYFSQMQPK